MKVYDGCLSGNKKYFFEVGMVKRVLNWVLVLYLVALVCGDSVYLARN